ncbi:MAG: hypothetical protein MUO43_13650, partial [Desulfobacterales bacterium]|nr:hypothetical protein [Desulfobacterales bacterium]
MKERKFLMFMSLLLAVATLAWGVEQSYAKNPSAPGQAKKVTQAQRQAAADSAAAGGFALPLMGEAMMAVPGDAPHYFSHPNYANSPLRMADAIINLVNAPSDTTGFGATAAATIDPTTGAITAITVTNPGSGYTVEPDVFISTAVVTPTSLANATAVLDGTGGVASVTVNTPGSGYVTPGG